MILTTLNIVLIALVVIATATAIILWTKRDNAINKAVNRAEKRTKQEMNNLEGEINRLKTLYNNLKANGNKTQEQSNKKTNQINSLINAENIILEQKKLEEQKNELAERNKKLWNMSISIQKEKQHIAILKNEIELKHKTVTESIQYAKRIQDAVLPPVDILANNFKDYFLFWRPREIVSGDFYWMKRDGDTILFSVADCTGHGVPGAFMSMLGVAFLNEICAKITEQTTPAEILEKMRAKIIQTLKQQMGSLDPKDGMDMGLCMLNTVKKTMMFAGANNGMYHIRGNQLTEYKAIKNPVGMYPKQRDFENHEVDIQTGDYIYMFSDGYADQFSLKNARKLTSGKFKKLLIEVNEKTKVAAEQEKFLADFLDDWKEGYVQMDDILVGGYQIKL